MASLVAAAGASPNSLCNYHVKDPVFANLFDVCKFSVGTLNATSKQELQADSNSGHAIASLYEIARNMYGLITNSHSLPNADVSRVCESEITFQGIGRVVLKPEDVANVTTNEGLDATVIELSDKCVAHLKERGAKFLRVASARLGDQVAMVQHQKGEFAVFKGVVQELSNGQIHYTVGVDVASVGSPLLLWDMEAVGLNSKRAGGGSGASESEGQSGLATRLLDIVAFHLVSRASTSAITSSAPHAAAPNSNVCKSSASTPPTNSGEENPLAKIAVAFPGDAVFSTDEAMFVTGMSADPVDDTVFLSYTMKTHTHESTRWRSGVREAVMTADGVNGLRPVRDAYTTELNGFVYGVGFIIATRTLIVCTNETVEENSDPEYTGDLKKRSERCLEALVRDADGKWNVVHHKQFENGLGPVRFAELSDANVLFGERYWRSQVLQLLHVTPEHHIESVARIDVPEGFHTFDARVIGGDSLVAFVANNKSHVRLSRLLPSNTLQDLSRIDLLRTQKLLWSGDHLLAGYWNKEHKAYSIVEAKRSGDTIAAAQTLLDEKNSFEWCFAGEHTAIFDIHTKELFIHAAQ